MRIQHNIASMNAYRNYNNNTSALSKNLEKLSSGYKINRAGDDAAGLAISEKMRAQITGLNAAQKNVKDGVSLVKTAEGAMQEIHDMLNRMDYLATQSANGTYDDPVDRANLQKEVDALKTEINRIAESANFNGIKLLDGSLDAASKTSKLDVGSLLPDAAASQILGTDTVLHLDPDAAKDTTFSIDIHNLSFPNKAGEDLEIQFGDNTLKIAGGSEVAETKAEQTGFTQAKAELTIAGKAYDVSAVKDQTDKKALAEEWCKQYNADLGATAGYKASLDIGGTGSVKVKFAATKPGAVTVDPFGKAIGTNGAPNAGSTGIAKTIEGKDGSFTAYADTGSTTDLTKLDRDTCKTTTTGTIVGADGTTPLNLTTATGSSAVLDGQSLTYGVTTSGNTDITSFKITFTTDVNANTDDGKTIIVGDHLDIDSADLTNKLQDALKKQIELWNTEHAAGEEGYVGLKESGLTVTFAAGGKINIDTGSIEATSQIYNEPTTALYTTTADVLATDTDLSKAKLTLGGQDYEVTGKNVKEQLESAVKQYNDGKDPKTDWIAKVNDAGDGVIYTKAGKQTVAPDGATISENEAWDASAIIAAIEGGKATLNGNALDATALKESVITGGNGEKGKFAVSFDKDAGTITFTQSNKDTADVTGNMDVRISVGDELVTKGEHGDYNWSTTNVTNRGGSIVERLASTKFDLTKEMVADKSSITIGKEKYTFTTDEANKNKKGMVYVGDLDVTSEEGLIEAASRLTAAGEGNGTYTVGNGDAAPTKTITVTEVDGQKNFDLSTMDGVKESLGFSIVSPGSGKALTLQIGDTSEEFNQMKVSVGDMHTDAMGSEDGETIADIDISTQEGAAKAVDVIKNAINYVSSVRGDLGAIQNRLEHTQNNLSVMAENIQDAESTIRDTDVAEEMMSYVKNNILVQSAQAMLAQANQLPQGVLQLLG